MHKISIIFLAFAAIVEFAQCQGAQPKQAKYFISNSKGLDYKLDGKKDEHRFGLEIKENKQFHHTKTAEDGVRLGCYGYELDGKTYLTSYVADGKGYRLVPKTGLITVYPKDGTEPRKASFDTSFTEKGEVHNSNVRYVFPEGCGSPLLEREIPPIEKKDEIIEIPEPETTTTLPEPVFTPYTVAPETCCDDNLPKILFPAVDSDCQDYVRLVVPVETKDISHVPIADIDEITKETNPVVMLLKLLKLLEKCKM